MSKPPFQQFLALFAPVELPVTLTLDSHRTFEQIADLIPPDLSASFIGQDDELPEEEFTEYLPCFILPGDKEFISLVYWKASLMRYDFIIATYTKSGIPISRQVIAGTSSDGKIITKKVATILPDGSIDVIASHQSVNDLHFDPSQSQELNYELMPNGFIALLNENE
jgi:hypothetical protein